MRVLMGSSQLWEAFRCLALSTQHLTVKQRRIVALKAVAIATGILLFFLLVGQLLPEQEQKLTQDVSHSDLADLAVYPLAMPSIASPGAMMAIVMLTDNHRYSLIDQAITAGNVGAAIISRVMGLILAAVALNNLLMGIRDFYIV